jgi:hypothetical protein
MIHAVFLKPKTVLQYFVCKVPFKKEFKRVVHNNYIQKTKGKLLKLTDNSKLYLYNKIKHDIVLEEYLIQEKNFKNGQLEKSLTGADPIVSNLVIVL